MGAPTIGSPYNRCPEEQQPARLWVLTQPRHSTADSYDYMGEEFAELYAARQKQECPLGDAPLVVLLQKPGKPDAPPPGTSADEWERFNDEKRRQKMEFTKLSRNSKLIVAENSGHHIHLDEPAVVTNAIRQVVEAARPGEKMAQ